MDETKKDELREELEKGERDEGRRHTAMAPEDEKAVTTADRARDATVAAGVEEHGNALATPEVEDAPDTGERPERGETKP